jgi:hypothetical protein
MLPNFIIIGAGKSGTTSLYHYLKSHPEVFMSPVKETNFFALKDEPIVDPKDDPDQMYHYPWSIRNWEDYRALFKPACDAKAIGEVSPMYLYSKKAAEGIKETLPGIKLVVILRNPVDRLYSRFLHLARENRLPSDDIKDALDRDSIWWRRNDLVQEGFYHKHLSVYFENFNPTQIKIFLYDELQNNPVKLVQELFTFIGVDPTFSPDLKTSHNVSGFIKNRTIDQLIGQNSLVKKKLQHVSPIIANSLRKSARIKKVINQLRVRNLDRPSLPKEVKNQLLENIYKNDLILLQELIQKDLSKWLKK